MLTVENFLQVLAVQDLLFWSVAPESEFSNFRTIFGWNWWKGKTRLQEQSIVLARWRHCFGRVFRAVDIFWFIWSAINTSIVFAALYVSCLFLMSGQLCNACMFFYLPRRRNGTIITQYSYVGWTEKLGWRWQLSTTALSVMLVPCCLHIVSQHQGMYMHQIQK